MSVYVDTMKANFGRYIMCHCWADSREELFAMMQLIGVQLKWFQRPASVGGIGMDASWEHFDIAQSKRALAIKHGAIETDKYGPVEHEHKRKVADLSLPHEVRLRSLRMLCIVDNNRRLFRND